MLQSAKNPFAGVALFLVGGDKVGYFLDRPHIRVYKYCKHRHLQASTLKVIFNKKRWQYESNAFFKHHA